MYRVGKVLNHNSVIAISSEDNQEYLMMGKGVGFGRKVSQQMEKRPGDTVYSLKDVTERGDAKSILKSVAPICLELADIVLNKAEKEFGNIDRTVLFPMADHLEYAIKRIQSHEQISNPLTDDIRVLFYKEYKVAGCLEPLIKERLDIQIDEHEVGYIALHIHSAIDTEKVSQSMQMARAVRECVTLVEEETGKKIDVSTLAYNRLMNHVRYMVARVIKGEKLKVNMNDYMEVKYPLSFETARKICDEIGQSLKCQFDEIEIGYLAMHIERSAEDEME
ncbi:MAG: PRD domain-containing protein [Hespellia sp.]|nr:PRD domain-containing protein [Hespellia sp.]